MKQDNALGLAISLALSNDLKHSNNHFVLAMGIDDLIDEGYTKEEIKDFILKCDYSLINSNITEDEKKNMQDDLLEILDSKYNSYIEQTGEKHYTKK